MLRLSKAQRTLLERAAARTYSDRSGMGAEILDGIQAGVYERLFDKALVSISGPCCGSPWGWAKATQAGLERVGYSSISKPEKSNADQ